MSSDISISKQTLDIINSGQLPNEQSNAQIKQQNLLAQKQSNYMVTVNSNFDIRKLPQEERMKFASQFNGVLRMFDQRLRDPQRMVDFFKALPNGTFVKPKIKSYNARIETNTKGYAHAHIIIETNGIAMLSKDYCAAWFREKLKPYSNGPYVHILYFQNVKEAMIKYAQKNDIIQESNHLVGGAINPPD